VSIAERVLAGNQFGDLLLHQLLVEELPAGDTIDLRTQGGDAVLVGVLHAGLARHRRTDQVIAQHQIGCGSEIADCHYPEHGHQQAGHPGTNRDVPDGFAAGENDGVGMLWPLAKYAAVLPLRHAIILRTGCR
jgi:hypothetical protein